MGKCGLHPEPGETARTGIAGRDEMSARVHSRGIMHAMHADMGRRRELAAFARWAVLGNEMGTRTVLGPQKQDNQHLHFRGFRVDRKWRGWRDAAGRDGWGPGT